MYNKLENRLKVIRKANDKKMGIRCKEYRRQDILEWVALGIVILASIVIVTLITWRFISG